MTEPRRVIERCPICFQADGKHWTPPHLYKAGHLVFMPSPDVDCVCGLRKDHKNRHRCRQCGREYPKGEN